MELSKKQLAVIALVIVLVITNIALAVLCVTRNVIFTGGVSVVGEIEIYQYDGTTPLTSYEFMNFTGRTPLDWVLPFYINNTGNQPRASRAPLNVVIKIIL